MRKPTPIEIYAQAVRSGLYIHPETEKNLPEPEVPRTEVPEYKIPFIDTPDPHVLHRGDQEKRSTISIILLTAVLLFLGCLVFLALSRENPHSAPKEVASIFNTDELVEKIKVAIVSIIPTRVIVRDRIVRVRDYEPGQAAALEQVAAWERIHEKLINNFYHTKVLGGKRSLCIKYGLNAECTVIDTIDILPDLPARLRTWDDAKLDNIPM